MTIAKTLPVSMIAVFSMSLMPSAATADPAQSQEPELTQVPGSRVFLVVPPGFTAAQHFSGFIHEKTGAILYVESSDYSNGTSERVYRKDVSIESIPFHEWSRRIDEYPDAERGIREKFDPVVLLKMMLEINVYGYAPASVADQVAEAMEVAGRSARNNPQALFTPLKPGFMLRRSPGLRKINVSEPTTDEWHGLYYNLSGTIDGILSDKVKFAVTFKPACVALTPLNLPRKEYEFWDFHEQADLDPRGYKPTQPMTRVAAGKLKGQEIVVREKWEGEPPIEVYAAVFRDGISCYVVKGFFPPTQRNKYLSQFKAAARSLVKLGSPSSPLSQTPAKTEKHPRSSP